MPLFWRAKPRASMEQSRGHGKSHTTWIKKLGWTEVAKWLAAAIVAYLAQHDGPRSWLSLTLRTYHVDARRLCITVISRQFALWEKFKCLLKAECHILLCDRQEVDPNITQLLFAGKSGHPHTIDINCAGLEWGKHKLRDYLEITRNKRTQGQEETQDLNTTLHNETIRNSWRHHWEKLNREHTRQRTGTQRDRTGTGTGRVQGNKESKGNRNTYTKNRSQNI